MLIECPECHQQISDEAVSCPHCGKVMKAQPSPSQEFFDTWRNQPEVKKIRKAQGCYNVGMLILTIIIVLVGLLLFIFSAP